MEGKWADSVSPITMDRSGRYETDGANPMPHECHVATFGKGRSVARGA